MSCSRGSTFGIGTGSLTTQVLPQTGTIYGYMPKYQVVKIFTSIPSQLLARILNSPFLYLSTYTHNALVLAISQTLYIVLLLTCLQYKVRYLCILPLTTRESRRVWQSVRRSRSDNVPYTGITSH